MSEEFSVSVLSPLVIAIKTNRGGMSGDALTDPLPFLVIYPIVHERLVVVVLPNMI